MGRKKKADTENENKEEVLNTQNEEKQDVSIEEESTEKVELENEVSKQNIENMNQNINATQNSIQSQTIIEKIKNFWNRLDTTKRVLIIVGIVVIISLISVSFMNPMSFNFSMREQSKENSNVQENTTEEENHSQFKWDDIVLKDIIPEPMSKDGEIIKNSEEGLSLDVYNIEEHQYDEYVDLCKENEFTIDTNQVTRSFSGFNTTGYELKLEYNTSKKKMSIRLNSPMKLQEIEWPDNEYAKTIPVPESKLGKIEKNSEYGFIVYLGNTSKEDFKEYVKKCKEKGFSVNVKEDEKSFSAKNQDSYNVNIEYKGGNIIEISMKEREFDIEIEIKCTENWIFSKYDVKVFIDKDYVSDGTIKHGSTETYKQKLKAGSHYIKFENAENKDVTGKVEFNLTKKENIKVTIDCTSSKVDAKITNLADIEAKKVKMVDVKGLTLDKAKEKIKGAGFENIKEETDDGSSIWVDSNWTVREQSVAPNEEVMSNTEIVLKCYKPETKTETSTTTTTPTYSSDEKKDPYDDTDHKYDAREAFEKAIEDECPWGVKFHWIVGLIASRYEGNGEYFFKVKVTIKNAYGTKRETTAEGRVNAAQGNKVTYTHIY